MSCFTITSSPCRIETILQFSRGRCRFSISVVKRLLTISTLDAIPLDYRILEYIKELFDVEFRDLCRKFRDLRCGLHNEWIYIFRCFNCFERYEGRVNELCISIRIRHSLAVLSVCSSRQCDCLRRQYGLAPLDLSGDVAKLSEASAHEPQHTLIACCGGPASCASAICLLASASAGRSVAAMASSTARSAAPHGRPRRGR